MDLRRWFIGREYVGIEEIRTTIILYEYTYLCVICIWIHTLLNVFTYCYGTSPSPRLQKFPFSHIL